MRKGKMIAQGAHAAMQFLLRGSCINEMFLHGMLRGPQAAWLRGDMTKIVVSVDSEAELLALVEQAKAAGVTAHTVIDQGRTEFNGVPTLTCAAFGPDYAGKLNPILGHLKLL